MFNAEIYVQRRKALKERMKSGVLFFPGNEESPMNYPDNPYAFRQDSTFLYYWGLDLPGLAAIIDIDEDKEIIFGYDFTVDDIVWMGPQETMAEQAKKVGVSTAKPLEALEDIIKAVLKKNRTLQFLPQYRAENIIKITRMTGIPNNLVNESASIDLIKAVVAQRSVKTDEEVAEIEAALDISYEMNRTAMKLSKPGITEMEVYGQVEGIVLSKGSHISFPVIFSVHGETLHNHHHNNVMKEGDLLVLDSGAESSCYYASDITRTYPVSGRFTELQKEIYNIVLSTTEEAIDMMKPGVPYKDVHLHAARVVAEGMKQLGFMKGDTDEAVKNGAHALFFPHGLGHMMGLDVHDMENLGENYVGYDETVQRSDQFGLAYLRLAKKLQPGYVVTVEPGIYFIPELIDQWKAEKMHADFIDYAKVEANKDFGGIRIEDDVLITQEGRRVLGKPIAKTVGDVEAWCAG
jgi:Xaa-Pro aminopeptidase